jgi:hypothetical protein
MYLAGLALINSSSPACGQVYNINDGKDRKMWEVILNVRSTLPIMVKQC